MEILRFGLGVRFDVMAGEEEQATPRQLWEEIFSVLTTSDVKGMHVYGGYVPYASEDPAYICVLTNGSLKEMRRVYQKLSEDPGVSMYLTATHPFLQSNALEKLNGLTFYGKVQSDGWIAGGDEAVEVRVGKKRGKRRPVGSGIVFLLAPDNYSDVLTSKQAIRRLTIAARNIFPGVRILPLPMANGGVGTVDAVLTACSGIRRTVSIKGPYGEQIAAHYAVLRGKTAVIETPETFSACGAEGAQQGYRSSFGLGELVRRAMDEGLTQIVFGCDQVVVDDMGLGLLRALGTKIMDEKEQEVQSGPEELKRLYSVDTEYMHARARQTAFYMMTECDAPMQGSFLASAPRAMEEDGGMEGAARLMQCMQMAAGKDVADMPSSAAGGYVGAVLMAFLGAKPVCCIDALIRVARMDARIEYVSLVVSGGRRIGADALRKGRPLAALAALCEANRVPLAILAGELGEGVEQALDNCNCSIFQMGDVFTEMQESDRATKAYDESANRMFRLIRIGREIERVSARKSRG